MKISLSQQIAEVERELDMRARVYPGLVYRRKMTQSEADFCTKSMEAVLNTLKWLQANEKDIKEYLNGKRQIDQK